MSRFAKRGMIVIVIVIAGLVLAGLLARWARQPDRGSVLEITFAGEIPEVAQDDGLASLLGTRELDMRDYVEAILRARGDDRINGLLVNIDGPNVGLAGAQELRDAILRFQDGGKWAAAYMETAGEFAPGNIDYYLATACGSIWLAPPGDINLTGLRFEVPFIRGALDKLNVVPDFDHIGKYKNAMNFFTHKEMTEAHREAMEALLEAFYRQLRAGIAESRGMSEEEVAELIDSGPFIGPRALEVNLVDELGYRDQLEDSLRERNGGDLPLVEIGDYLDSGRHYDRGVKVALIHGVGLVGRGESEGNPFFGTRRMGSDTVTSAIETAREDDSIKAIVFRVDSPGGSYVASDLIWRQVMLTKGRKPIVVSMSNLAGSGGYFVAMAADRIIAEPGTITASIGVLSGKFVTTELWRMLGITSDAVQRGDHATFYSSEARFNDGEREVFRSWLERIYEDFVGKVAEGRGMSFEEVDAIARGRIWSGEDALRLGLIDEIGGLDTAVRGALELVGLDPESPVRLVEIPKPKGLIRSLLDRDLILRLIGERLGLWAREAIRQSASPGPDQVLEMPFVPQPH